jgi:hypothetical protein
MAVQAQRAVAADASGTIEEKRYHDVVTLHAILLVVVSACAILIGQYKHVLVASGFTEATLLSIKSSLIFFSFASMVGVSVGGVVAVALDFALRARPNRHKLVSYTGFAISLLVCAVLCAVNYIGCSVIVSSLYINL